jgi:hypothetical protein
MVDVELAKKVISTEIVLSEQTAATSHGLKPDGYCAGYDAGYAAGLGQALKVLSGGYESSGGRSITRGRSARSRAPAP